MNFKTTTILIVLLAIAGAIAFFTRDTGTKTSTPIEQVGKVLSVSASDVDSLTIAPASGQQITLKRDGTNWQLTEPFKAPAEMFAADDLLRALTDLQSKG